MEPTAPEQPAPRSGPPTADLTKDQMAEMLADMSTQLGVAAAFVGGFAAFFSPEHAADALRRINASRDQAERIRLALLRETARTQREPVRGRLVMSGFIAARTNGAAGNGAEGR